MLKLYRKNNQEKNQRIYIKNVAMKIKGDNFYTESIRHCYPHNVNKLFI